MSLPTFVTHYYRASSRPFRNLSDLESGTALTVMRGLMVEHREGRQHRSFGATYLAMRQLTEHRLRELFIAAGGDPERSTPHYFVLGESPWFRGLAADMRDLRVPLFELPPSVTSFTYPDSFTAMVVPPEFGFDQEAKPYHGHVFRMDDLAETVNEFGLPLSDVDSNYQGYEHRSMEKYIEVQLWSDRPIKTHLARGR